MTYTKKELAEAIDITTDWHLLPLGEGKSFLKSQRPGEDHIRTIVEAAKETLERMGDE